jgi:hypothetical protein
MTIKNLSYGLSLFSATMIVAFSFSSVSFSQENPAAKQKAADIKLFYNYPADHAVKYLTTTKVIQDMDINGQSMKVNVTNVLGCTIKAAGMQENNIRLEISIDTMEQTIDMMGAISGGPVKEAIGKTFSMTISPEGKEVDFSGAEQVVFRSSNGDSANVAQYFNDFFPDMPAEPISPGFTWLSSDSSIAKTSSMTRKELVKSESKFEGFEKVGEINCAKITFLISGTQEMKMQSQGMDIKTYGPFVGKGELYFATAEGYFIKQVVSTRLQGTLEMVSEGATIPLVMEISSVNEVQK